MPKIKTHRGAAKRFKVSAGGKLQRRRSGLNHILTSKSTKRKRQLRKSTEISPSFTKTVKKLLQ